MNFITKILAHLDHHSSCEREDLSETNKEIRELLDLGYAQLAMQRETHCLLREILETLRGPKQRPDSLTLTLSPKGHSMFTGQKVVATVTEADAAGVNFPIDPSKISFSVSTDDQAVILFTDNLDGTATITAVAPGTATLNASDSQFKLTGSVTVTVTDAPPPADTPTTLTITLGEPQ